ncbi:hypothetical protein Tco_1098480 [Tanacetum coccineum]
MSSASSAVTYTSVYTDSEPGRVFWGADEEISDGGSPRVIVLGYDGLPIQPVAPPSPDYIPGPEDPQTPPVPQDEDDETEDGSVDYPMDGGDDGDDDDGDSSGDDADDEDEDEEEEKHLAPADSVVIVPIVEHVSSPEGTEPVISPPYAGERLARCTAPPALSSPPLVPSPLLPSFGCPTQIQTLRMASTQALIDAVTAALPSPPLPPLLPSLYLPPPIDRRNDLPESEQPPRKRLCLSTLGSRYEVGESSTARTTRGRGIDYGFVSTIDAEARRQGISEVGVTELAELHKRDTQDLYALLEDAQDGNNMDCGGGGLCFLRGLGSLDRIESGDPSGASAYRDHVYTHETHIQAHQAQL